MPPNVHWGAFQSFTRFDAHIYALGNDTTTNTVSVWRALAVRGNTAYTGEKVHDLTAGTTVYHHTLRATATAIPAGEYGDPTGGPSIWPSTTGAAGSWTRVTGPYPEHRHVHDIFVDPYRPGNV